MIKKIYKINKLDLYVMILFIASFMLSVYLKYSDLQTAIPNSGDSLSYLNYPLDSFLNAMKSNRTFGYPVLLKFYVLLTGDDLYHRLGLFQYFLYTLSVLALYFALLRLNIHRAYALVFTLPVLFVDIVFIYVGAILTDIPVMTFSIFTLSALLFTVARPNIKNFLLLGLLIFYTYNIRHAYLFWVLLAPALFILLRLIFNYFSSDGQLLIKKTIVQTLIILLVSSIPYVAFSSFRYLYVDSFGLCAITPSYGNIMVASVIMDKNSAENAPGDIKLLTGLVGYSGMFKLQQDYDFSDIESWWTNAKVFNSKRKYASRMIYKSYFSSAKALSEVSRYIINEKRSEYLHHTQKRIVFLLKKYFITPDTGGDLLTNTLKVSRSYLMSWLFLIFIFVLLLSKAPNIKRTSYSIKPFVYAILFISLITVLYALAGGAIIILSGVRPLYRYYEPLIVFMYSINVMILTEIIKIFYCHIYGLIKGVK